MTAGNLTQSALTLLKADRPLVIAHRGYSALAPENTLPAFKLALEAKADLVELDYRHSQDGVPMVIHDRTLDRTTDSRRRWRRKRIRVRNTPAAELQTLDAGSWHDRDYANTTIPLLSEALDFICSRNGIPLIEHKSGEVETFVRLLRDRDLINRVIVMSFDWAYLRAFHTLEPSQVLGALGPPVRLVSGRRPAPGRKRLGAKWLNALGKTGAQIVVWNRRVSGAAVALAHKRQFAVWVYTVNTGKRAARLVAQGANGIITNHVSLMRRALTERAHPVRACKPKTEHA